MKDGTKPSEYIRAHLSGSDNGFELDDMLSWHDRHLEWDDVLARVDEINQRHSRTGEPPLGVYKPEAHADLARLAEELEQQGR